MENKKQEETKYQITMNKRQLELLSYGCEQLARLIQGQSNALQDLFETAWERRCKKATGKMMDKEFDGGWYDMRADAEAFVCNIKKRFWGLGRFTENGIHYSETSDMFWEMYEVLRHQLWLDLPEDRKSPMTVDASPAFQLSNEPLIEVKKI